MRNDLEEKLCKAYPKLYVDFGKRESAMFYGISCGDGWYDIINELSNVIEQENNNGKSIKAAQVKQKFGGLRFYVDFDSRDGLDQIYDAINKAEKKSMITCERCGKLGIWRNNGGWITVTCDEHFKAKIAE